MLRELLAVFDISVDAKGLEKAQSMVDKLKGGLEGIAGISALKRVGSMFGDVMHDAAHTADLARQFGMASDEIQRFQFIAGQTGVPATIAFNSLAQLGKHLGHAQLHGGKAAEKFRALGIDVGGLGKPAKTLNQVFLEMGDALSKIKEPTIREAYALDMMGRTGKVWLPALTSGTKGIREMYKAFDDLGGGTAASIDQLKKSQQQLDMTKWAFARLKEQLAVGILPQFNAVLTHVAKIVVWFRDLEKHTYFATTALYALEAASAVLFARWVTGVASMLGLVKSGGFFAMMFELAPLIAAAAALFALYIVLDDIYTMFQGGESMIGGWLDELFGVGTATKVVAECKDAVKLLGETFEALGPTLGMVLDGAVTLFKNALPTMIDIAKKGFLGLKEILLGVGETIKWIVNLGGQLEGVFAKATKMLALGRAVMGDKKGAAQTDAAGDRMQADSDRLVGATGGEEGGSLGKLFAGLGHVQEGGGQLPGMSDLFRVLASAALPSGPEAPEYRIPLPSMGGGGGTNTMNQTNNITVHATSDKPKDIANESVEALKREQSKNLLGLGVGGY